MLTSYKTAPQNRYQPHPAEPELYTKCSNTVFVLLKMGIMMPKHVETEVNNKHLIVASFWFFSLHTLLTMHGHMNLKLKNAVFIKLDTVLASYNAAPHNRYQPHPAEPEQHTKCSNRAVVLLKMGITMPETC